MAYTQQTWADGSGGGTPIESNGSPGLNHIEAGLATADANATAALAQLGKPLGLTGATAAARFAGGTASGAPASGAFLVGDFVIDQSGSFWECTSSGSPGTWKQIQAVTIDSTSSDITTSEPGDSANAGSVGKAADAGHRHGREAAFTIPVLSGALGFPKFTTGTILSVGTMASGTWLVNVVATCVVTTGGGSVSITTPATSGITLSGVTAGFWGNVNSTEGSVVLTFVATVATGGLTQPILATITNATVGASGLTGYTAIKIA